MRMIEVYPPLSKPREHIVGLIQRNVSRRIEHGVPTLIIASAETHKIPPRQDTKLGIEGALKSIYDEGLRMGAVDSFSLSDDVSAEVLSSVPASGHTPYGVNYTDSLTCWDEVLQDYPQYKRPPTEPLVAGGDEGHAQYLPAQLITWIMLKIKTGPKEDDCTMAPVDIYQIAQAQEKGVLKVRVGGKNQSISITSGTFTSIYESIETHMKLHKVYLASLYNKHVRPEMNQRLAELGIELGEKQIENIVNTMALGYSRDQKKSLGVGGGPQSNPTAHIHTTIYPDIDELRRLVAAKVLRDSTRVADYNKIVEYPKFDAALVYRIAKVLEVNPEISNEDLVSSLSTNGDVEKITRWLEEFKQWAGENNINLHAVKSALVDKAKEVGASMQGLQKIFTKKEPVLGGIEFRDPLDPVECPPHVLFKQVDPCGYMFHQSMDTWVQDSLYDVFAPLGVTREQISSFVWHAEDDRFDMRVTEGWQLQVNNQDFARLNEGLNKFLHRTHMMWLDARDAWTTWKVNRTSVQLEKLSEEYGLTEEVIGLIKKIVPTDEQLAHWRRNPMQYKLQNRDQNRLDSRLEIRHHTRLRKFAEDGIKKSPELADRVANAGLFQVLGDGIVIVNGVVYKNTDTKYKFNNGLNIPGVPGFGIVYEKHADGTGWTIRIHPLLSEKSLAEFFAGFAFEREKGA